MSNNPRRKIIELRAAEYRLYALCDDNTLWQLISPDLGQHVWVRLPDIPQDAPH